jgi:hypothetical protein
MDMKVHQFHQLTKQLPKATLGTFFCPLIGSHKFDDKEADSKELSVLTPFLKSCDQIEFWNLKTSFSLLNSNAFLRKDLEEDLVKNCFHLIIGVHEDAHIRFYAKVFESFSLLMRQIRIRIVELEQQEFMSSISESFTKFGSREVSEENPESLFSMVGSFHDTCK